MQELPVCHAWTSFCLQMPPVSIGTGSPLAHLQPPSSNNMRTLSSFHKKILRGFLKLSSHSPIPGLYFLLGELPIEARVHINVFSLFYTILSNPETTVHQIAEYLARMTDDSSTTWTAHLRILSKKYAAPDPLPLLERNRTNMNKEYWKTLINTRITIYHEKQRRDLALSNSKMRFLNVQATGLTGCQHIALHNILTTQDVIKLRAHIKFLCCDLLTGEQLAAQHGGDARCRLCPCPMETTEHILTSCRPLHNVRERLLPELLNTVCSVAPTSQLLSNPDSKYLTQFILDCTSLNLPNPYRLSPQNPETTKIFKVSRDWCFAIMKERTRQLKALNE